MKDMAEVLYVIGLEIFYDRLQELLEYRKKTILKKFSRDSTWTVVQWELFLFKKGTNLVSCNAQKMK